VSNSTSWQAPYIPFNFVPFESKILLFKLLYEIMAKLSNHFKKSINRKNIKNILIYFTKV